MRCFWPSGLLLSAYDMLVTYVFDSVIFATFILHFEFVLKERWELSEKK